VCNEAPHIKRNVGTLPLPHVVLPWGWLPWRSPRSGFSLLGLDVARQRESEDAMSLPPRPPFMLYDTQKFRNGYTAEQMQAYGQACRAAALEDAMNATRAFGKTGAVIAAAIGALK
jgi:hypothetical protein